MIKVNNELIKPEYFPDGTMKLKYERDHEGGRFGYFDIKWLYDNEEEMILFYYLVNQIRNNISKPTINLFMPYIPNARFDRTKNKEEVFTLKFFSNFINDLHFDQVTVFDPHSHVSEALINNIVIEHPIHTIVKATERITNNLNDLLLFFPDEGSTKRYHEVIETFQNSPYAFGIKNRDWVTGEIKGLSVNGQVDQIKGRDILIIDDICSKGGTFYHSAKKLKELGAKNIYLYVSHCENSIYDGELLKASNNDLINRIYTTDSILTNLESPKIELVEEWRKL